MSKTGSLNSSVKNSAQCVFTEWGPNYFRPIHNDEVTKAPEGLPPATAIWQTLGTEKSYRILLSQQQIVNFQFINELLKSKLQSESVSAFSLLAKTVLFKNSEIRLPLQHTISAEHKVDDTLKTVISGTSLVAQWLRVHLPRHRVRVQSLTGELRSHKF